MDQAIKELQDFLKTSPLGVSYKGPSDGYSSPELVNATNSLQSIIKDKLSKSSEKADQDKAASFIILSGNKLATPVASIKQIINSLQNAPNQNVKSVQEVFNSNPFGIVYAGPKDGIMNQDFIDKLKILESKISEISNVSGKIVSGNNLITDANDLSKTFSLIKSYQEFLARKK